MRRLQPDHALYLRLPTRSSTENAALSSLALNFALVTRGRPVRTATASLTDLAAQIAQVSEVVLLLAASDVTLMRIAVPTISTARIYAALPSLIEENIIGDTADCAITLGPERDGQRLVAVCDRRWLLSWIHAARQLGARHLRLLPLSLCLPVPETQISSALVEHTTHYELAIRLSLDEGMGLIVPADEASDLPDAVAQLLLHVIPSRPVQLSVPTGLLPLFNQWLSAQQNCQVTLIEQGWHDWINASQQQPVDFAEATGDTQRQRFSWRVWRWPITLAAAVSVLNLSAIYLDFLKLRSQGLQLREEITGIYRNSFPNDAAVIDPSAQMRQKIATLRKAAGQLSQTDFLVLSAAVGEVWTKAGNDVQAIEYLDYRDGALTIKLKPNAHVSLVATQNAIAHRTLQITPSSTDPSLWQVSLLK